MSLNQWVADFKLRLHQIRTASHEPNLQQFGVWLGGLFRPEAYVTATRQSVAQTHNWSLEELELQLDIEEELSLDGFIISGRQFASVFCQFWTEMPTTSTELGLRLEGAKYEGGVVLLSSATSTRLSTTNLSWRRRQKATSAPANVSLVVIPVYLNDDRAQELFKVYLPSQNDSDSRLLLQHGVAIVA